MKVFQSDRPSSLARILLLVGLFAMQPGLAQEKESRGSVYIGVFWPDIDTSISFRSETLGIGGSLIDFEENLGLRDKDALPIIGVRWNVAKRHTLDLLYFQLRRKGTRTIDVQLSFPCDIIDPANCMPGVPDAPNTCGENLCILDVMSDVNSKFDVGVLRFGYSYAFYQRENTEWHASVGVHADRLEVRFADSGNILGGTVAEETTLPLPSFGLRFRHKFAPKWGVMANAEWFGIEFGEYKGDLLSATAAVEWRGWEKVGLALAWNYFEVDFEAGDSDFKGFFNWQYTGPMFAVKYDF